MNRPTLDLAPGITADPHYLLIKAKGGLGNRILSAVGGIAYAEATGRIPVIDWRDGSYAPPGVDAYRELFQPPAHAVRLEDLPETDDVTPSIWQGHLATCPADMIAAHHPDDHSNPRIYRHYCVPLGRAADDSTIAVYWSYLPKFGRMRRVLDTCETIDQRISRLLGEWFTPNARVLHRVEQALIEIPRPMIGVHVRYTDMRVPLSRIVNAVARRVDAMPAAALFLATDSADVESHLKQRFGQIHAIEKWLPPSGARLHGNTEAPDMLHEAENALVDMWALSRSDALVYARRSTFSETSRLVGALRPEQVTDIDRFNPRVRLTRLMQSYV